MENKKYGSDAQLTWSLPVFLVCQNYLICEILFLVLIFFLLADGYFGNLFWVIEKEIDQVINMKVVHFYMLSDDVQKDWEV